MSAAASVADFKAANPGSPKWRKAQKAERILQASLLRDIFGNSSHAKAVRSSRKGSEVVALAEAIYHNRAFNRLSALANGLEQAGCRDKEILAHCRGPGPHVRGCWVVDLLLGKE